MKRTLFLLLALPLLLLSCSKERAPESSLLLKLPTSTAGYLLWDSTVESYAAFRASPWGKPSPLSDSVKFMQSAGLNPAQSGLDLEAFIRTVEKTGLIATTAEQQDLIEQALLIIDTPPIEIAAGQQVQVAAYLQSKSDVNMQEKFAQIRAEFERQLIKTTDITLGSLGGFSVTLPVTGQLAGSDKMLFAASKQSGAIASSERLLTHLLNASDATQPLDISKTQHYTKAVAQLGSTPHFARGYLDTRKVMLALENSLPEATRSSLDAENFPIIAVAFGRGFNQSVADTAVISLAQESDTQKSWAAALKAASNDKATLNAVPKGVLGIISIDGALLRNLREVVLSSNDKEEATAIRSRLVALDTLKRISIAIRNSSTAASPFPEILLAAESADPAGLVNTIVQESANALSGAGLPISAWQQKTIAGAKSHYLVTPIGIGIYITSSGNFALLASSERALADALSAFSKPELQLASALTASSKEMLSGKPTLVSTYVDFAELATTIESVKGSLAMFTGGSPALEQIEVERMKTLGRLVYAATFDDSQLTISGRLEGAQ